MHILTITNRKGGTGKTTVSVNLAAEFAALGHRVLLIDLDSQGHCAVGLGIKQVTGAKSAHDLFTDSQAKLSDAIRPSNLDNLSLAPADTRFDHSQCNPDETRLKRAITEEGIDRRFDIVVIDTPPSLDLLLMNALLAATHVVVPYVPHHLSFEGVRQLVRVLLPVMTRRNRGLKIAGFIPTMANERIRQHRTITGNVSTDFGESKLLPTIRSDIRLAEAMAKGEPIRSYAIKSRGAEDFATLATEVLRRIRLPAAPGAVD